MTPTRTIRMFLRALNAPNSRAFYAALIAQLAARVEEDTMIAAFDAAEMDLLRARDESRARNYAARDESRALEY